MLCVTMATASTSANSPELALFLTLENDNLEEFQSVLASNEGLLITYKDRDGNSILHKAIENESCRIFDYLLSLNDILINRPNLYGITPLITALDKRQESFSIKLIEKGCKINSKCNRTALHDAIENKCFDVVDSLIEHGADLDAQNGRGETPLLIACKERMTDEVFMLLFFGADPNIACSDGVSAVDELALYENETVQTFFFNTLLPCYKTLHIDIFTTTMRKHLDIFPKLLEMTENVKYGRRSVRAFKWETRFFKPEYFEMFINKFGDVAEKAVCDYYDPVCPCVFTQCFEFLEPRPPSLISYLKNIGLILNSSLSSQFIETFKQHKHGIADCLRYHQHPEKYKVWEKIVYMFLSYGINPKSYDLDTIYKFCGYSELFKTMLHMDIECLRPDGSNTTVARLIYDVGMTIEEYLDQSRDRQLGSDYTTNLISLCDYSALPKVKRHLLKYDEKLASRIEKLPNVPFLTELARNKARFYIVDRFKMKNSRQFYTVLKQLPVRADCKEILSLERKLYPI